MTLYAQFLAHTGRPIHKWSHYFPVYENHLDRFRNRPVLVFEIGCGEGGSLQMWKKYLGPHAHLVGIDIDPAASDFAEDQIDIRIGDQSDTRFLQSLIDEFGGPDIVIDDGSHRMDHIRQTFDFLFEKTSETGVYLVEDLHTAYWPEFGGGLGEKNSFLEFAKSLIDDMHADYTRGALNPTAFTQAVMGMHFYDSLIVFERGRLYERRALLSDQSGVRNQTQQVLGREKV